MKIGVDIVEVDRMKGLLKRRNLDSVFSKKEQERIFSSRRAPEIASSYFAAKEALSKAMGTGIWKMGLSSVEILHEKSGKPYYHILNPKKIPFSQDSMEVTITHDGGICIAVALLEEDNFIGCDELRLERRDRDSHKGDYGRVALIGGSTGMSGSAYLGSLSALRTGSGLVYTLVPETISQILQIKSVENIILPIKTGDRNFSGESTKEVLSRIKKMDALGIGPGLGQEEGIDLFVRDILKNTDQATVIDADGLNAISKDMSFLKDLDQDIIITPHPLEMARLLQISAGEVQKDRIGKAILMAKKYGITVLLKGHETIVTDGDEIYINKTGNPGMATAGSGDVLTGIVLSLLGQGYSSMEAGKIGAYVHGLAGDMAADDLGERGMIASDIIKYLPYVLKRMEN